MLTGKQRSFLRKMANAVEPVFQIGKGGMGGDLVSQVSDALEARELVKITILRTAGLDAREACDQLAALTGAEPVQAIGNRIVLYRESKSRKRIEIT